MAKQKRRKSFSDPQKREKLQLAFKVLAQWARKKAADTPSSRDSFNRLADTTEKIASVCIHFQDPVIQAARSRECMDGLVDVTHALSVIKGQAEGDPDRCNPALRTADRRILQFCEDVSAQGGSFNCARPKPLFVGI